MYISDSGAPLLRHVFAENGLGTQLYGLGDKAMAVYLCAFHGNEKMPVFCVAGINVYPFDVDSLASNERKRLDILD